MRKLLFVFIMVCFFSSHLLAQDVIVKKDGTILNVYNLEIGSTSYFYTLDPSDNSEILKISKDEVFSTKKSDDKVPVQLNGIDDINESSPQIQETVTATFTKRIKGKGFDYCFSATTPDGKQLNYAVLSETEHTLAVIKGEYHETDYVIPEFVMMDDVVYTVTEIAEKAFYMENSIEDIHFPQTLKKIGKNAFVRCTLQSIILPEGLEEIGNRAFMEAGWSVSLFIGATGKNIREIYLPASLRKIGESCFFACGTQRSPRGYCQAYFSNMPKFITEATCKTFGIDEEAVRGFYDTKEHHSK